MEVEIIKAKGAGEDTSTGRKIDRLRVAAYCRVSTDEQSYGNSLDYQEMRLKEYCNIMQYEIFEIIKDDKSGKDFNRNGWKHIRSLCKLKSNGIESILLPYIAWA